MLPVPEAVPAGLYVAATAGCCPACAQLCASSFICPPALPQLNVCIALVEPLPPTPADQQAAAQAIGLAGGMPPPAVDAAAAEVHAGMRAQATQCIARSIDRLVGLLEAADQGRQLPTSYGLLHPPVGLPRLKAVELLAALLHSGDEAAGAPAGRGCEGCMRGALRAGWSGAVWQGCLPVAHVASTSCFAAPCAESAVMGTRGVQRSMELFLAFPFNNVLHRHVATLVMAVDKGSPALAQFFLQDCGLLGWLVDAPTKVGSQHLQLSVLTPWAAGWWRVLAALAATLQKCPQRLQRRCARRRGKFRGTPDSL